MIIDCQTQQVKYEKDGYEYHVILAKDEMEEIIEMMEDIEKLKDRLHKTLVMMEKLSPQRVEKKCL